MQYNINTFVDKIFYINLDKDKERNEHILKQFQKFNIYNFERIPGTIIDNPDIYKHKMLGPYNGIKNKYNYYKGSIGCLLSHQKIIKIAKKRKYKKILILEDDILFKEDFNQKFNFFINKFNELNKYWNIIYLGLDNWKDTAKNKFINDFIVRILGGGFGTHAYILNKNIYDYILLNINYLFCEIDIVYNTLNNLKCTHSYKFSENIIYKKNNFTSNISFN